MTLELSPKECVKSDSNKVRWGGVVPKHTPPPNSHSLQLLLSRSPGWRQRTCEVTLTEFLLLSVAVMYPLSLSQPYLVQDSGGSFFTRSPLNHSGMHQSVPGRCFLECEIQASSHSWGRRSACVAHRVSCTWTPRVVDAP